MKNIIKAIVNFFKYHLYDNVPQEKRGLTLSTLVHTIVFLAFLILPFTILNSVYNSLVKQQEDEIVYVDLDSVKISTKTNLNELAAKPKEQEKKEEAKPEPKKIKVPTPKTEVKKEEKTKEEPKKEEFKIDNTSEKIVKEIKEQKETQNFEQINKSKDDLPETTDPNFIKREKIGEDKRVDNEELSVSIKDAIRAKLRSCWNVDPNALGAQDMKIAISVDFDISGNVTRVDIEDKSRFETDMPFRAAASSARRAVFTCSPLDFLPKELYEKWKTADFNFYPNKGELN